jgi:hypothetical protein
MLAGVDGQVLKAGLESCLTMMRSPQAGEGQDVKAWQSCKYAKADLFQRWGLPLRGRLPDYHLSDCRSSKHRESFRDRSEGRHKAPRGRHDQPVTATQAPFLSEDLARSRALSSRLQCECGLVQGVLISLAHVDAFTPAVPEPAFPKIQALLLSNNEFAARHDLFAVVTSCVRPILRFQPLIQELYFLDPVLSVLQVETGLSIERILTEWIW